MPSVSYYHLCLLLDDGVVHNWVLFRVPFGLRLFLGVLAISAVGSVVDLGVVFFWLAIFPPSVMLSVSEVVDCPPWSLISCLTLVLLPLVLPLGLRIWTRSLLLSLSLPPLSLLEGCSVVVSV